MESSVSENSQFGGVEIRKAKIKILVVEDEISVAMLMAHLLTRVGCHPKVALTVRQGLQLAEKEPFDVITLDADIPELDGYSPRRQLTEIARLKNTPIVFLSADTDISRGHAHGAADYIVMPFDGNDFVCRILSQIHGTTMLGQREAIV